MVEPVPIEEMYRKVPDGICSVLREIYWETSDPDTRVKIRVAVAMAKKMSDKLEWYYERSHSDRGWEKEVFRGEA